jgi:hypothetical protein
MELRAQGQSWRKVAYELGIGTATAMRLSRLDAMAARPKTPVGLS